MPRIGEPGELFIVGNFQLAKVAALGGAGGGGGEVKKMHVTLL